MKNQSKHIFSPQDSANLPASISGVNRNSPAKGSIKIVLPPAIPKKITIETDALSLSHHDPNGKVNCVDDPQFFYDGNNYYSTKTSMIHQSPQQQNSFTSFNGPSSLDSFNQSRYSSVSYDSGRGTSEPVKGLLMTSKRASIQSYESIASSSSNKDSDSSQQSSISSSSTSSSFCSSSSSTSSSSSSSFHNKNNHSNQKLSESRFASTNNVFKSNPNKTTTTMKDNLIAKAGPLTIAEMLLHGVSDSEMIHVWLQKIQMDKYEENFLDAAYDMATIARMNPQDLIAIGITDPQSRSIFTAEIQKLKIPDNLPSFKPSTLEEWLKMLNLDCYYNCLCQQGYSTIERVTELTWEDLEDVGINKLGHQKKILLAIKKIKSMKTNGNNNNYESISSMPETMIYSSTTANRQSNNFDSFVPVHVETQQNQLNIQQPYQDVMIKMYANTNSPNHHPDVKQKEICLIDNRKNILPLPSTSDSKSQMHTFQQQQQNQMPNPSIDYNNVVKNNQCLMGNYSRRKSLESLNTNENINYCSSFSSLNVPPPINQHSFIRPPPAYQYSNCDLTHNNNNNGINRQTICFENQIMNTFAVDPQYMNYDPNATNTLPIRPKILMKSKFLPPMIPRQQLIDNNNIVNCTPLIHSNENKMNSSTSDVYASFKKKPPPPPRRSNSIREPNSMPTTPTHTYSIYNRSQSNRFDYLPNNDNQLLLPTNQNSLKNEDFFASCVKSLTNHFSETNFSNKNSTYNNNIPPNSLGNLRQSRTLPSPSNNNNKETWIENNNISSSSSGESMYFAHDNVGTIRQRPNNFQKIQNLDFKYNNNNKSSSSTTSSSSTPSTPGSDNILSSFSNRKDDHLPLPLPPPPSSAASLLTDSNNQSASVSNDSSQNIVDSLEHIEMMLATLKTQLDSID